MAKILIVDDSRTSRRMLRNILVENGHEVIGEAENGQIGFEKYIELKPDIVTLDITMPVLDGLSVLKTMRQKGSQTPVLLLTAKDSVEDRVRGLDAGANDYLVKPFAFEELLARIRVLLRKPKEAPQTVCKLDDLEVHLDTHQVLRAGHEIKLSGKEFALLRYLIQNTGIVLSRDRLEQHLWNYDYAGSSNVIDVYIRYLRKKIDEGSQTKLIHTVRGAGYVMRAEP